MARSDNRLFIGINKSVICRDVSKRCDEESPELWRFEFKGKSRMYFADTFVTFTNDIGANYDENASGAAMDMILCRHKSH